VRNDLKDITRFLMFNAYELPLMSIISQKGDTIHLCFDYLNPPEGFFDSVSKVLII